LENGAAKMTTAKQTRVLVVDDEPESVEWMQVALELNGFDVRTAEDGRSSEVLSQIWNPDVVLLELVLPDVDGLSLLRRLRQAHPARPIIVVSGRATVPITVEALSAGAFTVLEKPVSIDRLVKLLEEASGRSKVVHPVSAEVETLGRMRTQSPAMKRIFEMLRTAAPTDVSVLIVGENGTGKELIAAALHDLSRRQHGPFVKINCAAIPAELLESELFGSRKGAYTGAIETKKGLFELAHRGSILLDEIGEMAATLQTKLLRVLQDREFRPLGGTQNLHADFRLICATNIDPAAAVREGRLREDLYFRLNTIVLTVPPLRERTEDIRLLTNEFLDRFVVQYGRPKMSVQEAAFEVLERHRWPGNIRELEHVVERAVILARGDTVAPEDLPESVRAEQGGPGLSAMSVPRGCTLDELERLVIMQTLELTRWNKRATANILGIHRPTLYNKLRKYRLWRREDRFRRDVPKQNSVA
jgi:DNA-binding NtrC family response regulator